MSSTAAPGSLGGRLAGFVVSLATALVLLGVSIVPFLTPAWIHFEQDRSHAQLVGNPPYDTSANEASDLVVGALLFGGDFQFTIVHRCGGVGPCPQDQLLDAREASHMRDVRGVFQGLALLVLVGAGLLVLMGFANRRRTAGRAAWWRSVSRGGVWLAGFMIVIGLLAVVAFDAIFQVFHELLFPAGSFTFDPATEHLVQLYPDQFWSDTTLALGLLAIGLAIVVAVLARRRASRIELASGAQPLAAGAGSTVASPKGAR